MKKLALLILTLCAGCAGGLNRFQQMHDDSSPSVQLAKYGQTCQAIGQVPGTPGYRRCVAQLSNAAAPDAAPQAPTVETPIEETVHER